MTGANESALLGLSQRQPPCNLQAEQALLGALLANNRAYDRVSGFLDPKHFADPIHGRIYQSIARRIDAGQLADAVVLKAEFEHSGVLQEVGGTQYLAQLLSAMVGIINAGEYGRAIHDTWLRRQLIEIGELAINSGFGADPEIDGAGAIADATDQLLSLAEASVDRSGGDDLGAALDGVVEASNDAAAGRGGIGLLTGLPTLDAIWRGMWPGSLTILGARSQHGKTAVGMQVAQFAASNLVLVHSAAVAADRTAPKEHVLFVSTEMPKADLGLRMLAAETGISADDIRAGQIHGARASEIIKAQARLRELPLRVNDTARNIAEICRAIRIARRQRHIRLAVIDHLHRIQPDATMGRMPRNEQIPRMAQMLKDTAKACGIPILLLAQCKTRGGVDQRDDQRPTIADILYGSEQDADDIVLMWRPEIDMGSRPPEQNLKLSDEKIAEANSAWWARRNAMRGRAEFIMAKRRFGGSDACWLGFDGPRTRFTELDADGQGAMPV